MNGLLYSAIVCLDAVVGVNDSYIAVYSSQFNYTDVEHVLPQREERSLRTAIPHRLGIICGDETAVEAQVNQAPASRVRRHKITIKRDFDMSGTNSKRTRSKPDGTALSASASWESENRAKDGAATMQRLVEKRLAKHRRSLPGDCCGGAAR